MHRCVAGKVAPPPSSLLLLLGVDPAGSPPTPKFAAGSLLDYIAEREAAAPSWLIEQASAARQPGRRCSCGGAGSAMLRAAAPLSRLLSTSATRVAEV